MVEAAKMADRDKLFDHNTYYGVDSGEDSQWGSPTGYYSGSSDFQSAFGTQSAFGGTLITAIRTIGNVRSHNVPTSQIKPCI